MAQHNPQSRAFLLIVLAGIVVGFSIASLLTGCSESETEAEQASEPTMEEKAQGTEPSSSVEIPMEGMSMDETPPDEEPMDGEGMTDDMSPPDEMIDEPLLDAVPDAVMPEPTPEEAAPETPPPAQNP